MARLTANGAIVSDDGQWYYDGFRWKPLVATAPGKPPGFISPEGKQLLGLNEERRKSLGWSARTVGQSGEELAALVAQHGSLEAAERSLAEPQRPANYGLRSEDGRWWWDGERWQPA